MLVPHLKLPPWATKWSPYWFCYCCCKCDFGRSPIPQRDSCPEKELKDKNRNLVLPGFPRILTKFRPRVAARLPSTTTIETASRMIPLHNLESWSSLSHFTHILVGPHKVSFFRPLMHAASSLSWFVPHRQPTLAPQVELGLKHEDQEDKRRSYSEARLSFHCQEFHPTTELN